MPDWLRATCREPLFHFAIIGALIFAAQALIAPSAGPTENQIVVSQAEIDRLSNLWQKRWRRPPTASDRAVVIEDYIREEIANREALAMGLDEGDSIIRQRLRQKFEFVAQELAMVGEPDATAIETWFVENDERYRTPDRISFQHVFLNPDKRSAATEDARVILASLRNGNDLAPELMGDASLLDTRLNDVPLPQIDKVFGPGFAEFLLRLEPGEWSGPVGSSYGLHIVRVEAITEGGIPPLAKIEPRVRADMQREVRILAEAALYRELRTRYDVVIEQPGTGSAETMGSGSP